ESGFGSKEPGVLPWFSPLMVAPLEPDELPKGLPEMPPILLEGDDWTDGSPSPGVDRMDSAVIAANGSVWLAGCDPRTLLMGWEDPGATPLSVAAPPSLPLEWRLRSESEPLAILATGTLPADRRFLFLQDPPPATAHVVEVGTRSPQGHWECLASSAPVSLPQSLENPVSKPVDPLRLQDSGLRPGIDPSHFERILRSGWSPSVTGVSSEGGLKASAAHGERHIAVSTFPSSGSLPGAPESDSSSSLPETPGLRSGSRADDFWFRVNAEVVLHGSTRPGARLTIFGRPVELRSDGSFTFRCALPDGRSEVPLRAIHPDGTDVREATVAFARQTRLQGVLGLHPGAEELPLPDSIP
ncbi:MAG: hypothetical protein RLZ45_1169, partial [Verrucomicrobiota bacterium]